jgi:hypothetical protein
MLGALDAGRRPHALDGGYPLKAGKLFGSAGFNDFPAPFELVDISDELQDFRLNIDVLDGVHRQYSIIG